jgi:hypothetical protein
MSSISKNSLSRMASNRPQQQQQQQQNNQQPITQYQQQQQHHQQQYQQSMTQYPPTAPNRQQPNQYQHQHQQLQQQQYQQPIPIPSPDLIGALQGIFTQTMANMSTQGSNNQQYHHQYPSQYPTGQQPVANPQPIEESEEESDDDDDESESFDERTKEAIKWFNNLPKSSKYELITNTYELHMSLKDKKMENVIQELRKKWKIDSDNLYGIINSKDIDIKKLQFENDVLTNAENRSNEILKQLNNKLTSIEKGLEKGLQNSLLSSSPASPVGPKIIKGAQYVLQNIPNCIVSNCTKGLQESDYTYNLEIESFQGSVYVTDSDSESIIKLMESFRHKVLNNLPAFNFALFIAQKAESINGRKFYLDIIHNKYGILFFVYIADSCEYPERIITAVDTLTVLLKDFKYSEHTNYIMNNINQIIDKIDTIRQNNRQLKNNIITQSEIVNTNDALISNLFDFIKSNTAIKKTLDPQKTQSKPVIEGPEEDSESEGSEEEDSGSEGSEEEDIVTQVSNYDDTQKIFIEITKRYLKNGKIPSMNDIVAKAESLYGIKSSSTKTIVSRQLGGIKNIKQIASELLKSGEACKLNFDTTK